MASSIRRSAVSIALALALAATLTGCGSDDPDDSAASDSGSSDTTAVQVFATTTSPDSSGTAKQSGPTGKVRFINVWTPQGTGSALDIYVKTGVDAFDKLVTNLAYGSTTDDVDVSLVGGGSNLQVTKTGEPPDKDSFANNLQVSGLEPGQHGLMAIGWDPTAGAGDGGSSFRNYTVETDDTLAPVDGKAKITVNKTGDDRESFLALAVVGAGCLGDDGLNEPSVELDPGQIEIQAVDMTNSSTGGCQGDVKVPPVTIDAAAGSSWLVALYGVGDQQQLLTLDVTPS